MGGCGGDGAGGEREDQGGGLGDGLEHRRVLFGCDGRFGRFILDEDRCRPMPPSALFRWEQGAGGGRWCMSLAACASGLIDLADVLIGKLKIADDPGRIRKLARLYDTERFRSDSPAAGSAEANALAPLGWRHGKSENDPAG
jgi:hypothetical protein